MPISCPNKDDMEKEGLREQADRLFLQGLRSFAGSAKITDAESIKRAAGFWNLARELYLKAGDKDRADELMKSLSVLHKKEYLKSHKSKKEQNSVIEKFKDWFMFFKIGCFGFGGPMAVFTLLEDELVRQRQILTHKDFLEGAVLGDVLPGPVTMDIVTYTGYKLRKWHGAFISTLAFIFPSFVIMLILAAFYDKYSISPEVAEVLKSLGAAVTGLIISVALKLTKTELKGYRELCMLVWAFASSIIFKLDIVVIVGLCGIVGVIIYHNDSEGLLGQ